MVNLSILENSNNHSALIAIVKDLCLDLTQLQTDAFRSGAQSNLENELYSQMNS